MEGERQPPAAAPAAVSKVLDDDDLLIEILLRVSFPTNVVRAALVCKRWLGHVSVPSFLRRFCELHPPRLLGFYIEDSCLPTDEPPFVPMLPQPAELAAVVRRASFKLDTHASVWPIIQDCRNGSVFIRLYKRGRGSWGTARVHSPLCPERGLAILPPPVLQCRFSQVLSKEEEGGLSYYYLYVVPTLGKPESRLRIYMLQHGSCRTHHLFDIDQLPYLRAKPKAVLADNKIYMAAEMSDIIVLDLTTSSFSIIQPPQGVVHGQIGTTMLARADDASGVYLIHVEELQVRIWLHKGDNWLLVDTICLRETCANLRMSGCIIEDEHAVRLMNQVVDYGNFVFLRMGGCALHLDIKRRTLRKVYETEHGCLRDIHPFMMIWPPTFPALKYDPARNAT